VINKNAFLGLGLLLSVFALCSRQANAQATAAQDEKHSIIYVKHLEPPYYPPLPRMTRVGGTIEMKLRIGADGTVLSIESVPIGFGGAVLTILKDGAERNVKTWTFGCVGCSPNAPFEHAIKFKYVMDNNMTSDTTKTVMDLPDEVTISAGPVTIDHGVDTKISKKRSN
jgi:hypothetical protein